jgi:hypothetical protein
MAEEKTRVDFNAPKSLVERADRGSNLGQRDVTLQ